MSIFKSRSKQTIKFHVYVDYKDKPFIMLKDVMPTDYPLDWLAVRIYKRFVYKDDYGYNVLIPEHRITKIRWKEREEE